MPGVYDDEKEKVRKLSPDGSHDDLGVHPERREAEVDSLEKLYNSDSEKETNSPQIEAKKHESEALAHNAPSEGSWTTNTDNKPKKSRFRLTRKNAAIGGGVAGLLIGGSIGIAGFLAGPLQFIHFAQLLEQFHFSNSESFTDGRAGKLIKWARTRHASERRNMGALGNKIADHYDAKLREKGMTPEYNSASRLGAIEVDTNTPEGERSLEKIRESGFDPEIDHTTGIAKVSLDSESASTRRKAVTAMVGALDINSISTAVASRVLKVRAAVDFHPLKNISRAADEKLRLSFEDYVKKVQEDRTKNITKGETENNTSVTKKDSEKQASESEKSQAGGAADETVSQADAIEDTAKATTTDVPTRASAIKENLSRGVGVAGLIALTCGVQQLGENVGKLQESNIVQPLIRTGMNIITTGNQVMSGQDVNMDQLGALSQNFYNDKDHTSWASARSIQAQLGNSDTGPDIPDSAKPGKDKPAFFKVVDTVIGSIPGANSVCSVATGAGGVVLDVAGWVIDASGPVELAANIGFSKIQDLVVSHFVDDLVRWIAGDLVNVAGAKGAELGSYADYGAFLSANNTMKSMGGRALTNSERVALNLQEQNDIKQNMKNQTLYARLFDPYKPNSLVAKTFLENPNLDSTQSTIATIIKTPLTAFGNIGKSLSSLIPGTYAAAATPYDYGVDEYGFSINEMDNQSLDNPYDNAAKVEQKLADLNSKYGEKCFGTTIDPDTGKIKVKTDISYIDLEKEKNVCGASNTDPYFLRYRMYLADKVTLASMACYEGVDADSCQEIGLTNNPSSSTDISAAPNAAEAKGQDTSAQQCTIGKDAGVGDTPVANIKIRLCNVGGIIVNVAIEKNVKAVIDGGAAAGIKFGGGGYRSYASQIEARKRNGCPDIYNAPSSSCRTPTAKPGQSMHEWGLAVDFSVQGSRMTRGSVGFNWLSQNQPVHQLINLQSEPWHWSVNGH